MKSIILTAILLMAAGVPALMAQGKQAQSAKPGEKGAPPAQQQQQQPQLVPGTKSPGESQAVIALFQAQSQQNQDGVIKAADELLSKYADTTFKESALLAEAQAYQQKGDYDKAQIFNEQALEVNPKSFQATLALGEMLAQRTRENDLDKEEKLSKADKYLNGTIDSLKTAAKPNPQLPDAQWEEIKKFMTAQAHNDLGMVALTRKKYDTAVTEFKTAIEGDAQPAYQVRLAMAYQQSGNSQEAIAICDKLLADQQLHPQIRQVATQIKNAASAKK
jgi:tetratricopeptide (TPR) repeat protein